MSSKPGSHADVAAEAPLWPWGRGWGRGKSPRLQDSSQPRGHHWGLARISAALLLGSALLAAPAFATDPVIGAIVGGGAGALIGKTVGGHNGAIIGGAIGAAAGASVSRERHHAPMAPVYAPPPPRAYVPAPVMAAPMVVAPPVRYVEYDYGPRGHAYGHHHHRHRHHGGHEGYGNYGSYESHSGHGGYRYGYGPRGRWD